MNQQADVYPYLFPHQLVNNILHLHAYMHYFLTRYVKPHNLRKRIFVLSLQFAEVSLVRTNRFIKSIFTPLNFSYNIFKLTQYQETR